MFDYWTQKTFANREYTTEVSRAHYHQPTILPIKNEPIKKMKHTETAKYWKQSD